MKEVDVPVLVDVTRRRHAGGTFEGQADIASHVLEGAVAHVAVQRGRRRRPHQQEIDVAPVVVVGRDYGADGLRVAKGRGSRDIFEGPLAAVAKQTRRGRGATDQQIEVAIVIGVEPCGGAIGTGYRGKSSAGRGVDERLFRLLAHQRNARRAQHEEIGIAVVVGVAGDRGGRRCGERGVERHAGELAVVVAIQLQSAGPCVDEVDVAIAVEIGQRQAARICGGGIRRHGAEVDESHVGHGVIDEPGLSARRSDRFRVASLLEIRLRERHRVAALAQLLELVHRRAALVCRAAAHQRGGEAVGGGGVERLGLDGRPQQLDRLVEAALLHEELSEIDRRADVGRIELAHPCERPHRIVCAIGGARDQAEHVVGLRPIGQRGLRRFELLARGLRLAAVEERNAQVEARQRQRRIDLEGAAEGRDGGGEVVLLEARNADVVGPVGVLPGGQGGALVVIARHRKPPARHSRRTRPRAGPRWSRPRCRPAVASS